MGLFMDELVSKRSLDFVGSSSTFSKNLLIQDDDMRFFTEICLSPIGFVVFLLQTCLLSHHQRRYYQIVTMSVNRLLAKGL